MPNQEEYPDVVRVINSERALWQTAFSEEEMAAVGISQETEQDLIAGEANRNYLVALEHDRVVGFTSWYAKTPDIAWISMLHVDAPFYKQGVGSQLLAQIEQEVYRQNISHIALETQKKATWAIRFYEKYGYHTLTKDESENEPYTQALSRPLNEDQPYCILTKELGN